MPKNFNYLKALQERRNEALNEMEGLVEKAGEEKRSLDETETSKYEELKTEIGVIDGTIKKINEVRDLDNFEKIENTENRSVEENDKEETRAAEENFLTLVRTGESRAFKAGDNGEIIPTHIANMILDRVKEISPLYSMVTTFNVSGDLVFPVYDESDDKIQAGYVEEMQEVLEHNGKFVTKKLTNNIVGALTKISKSLLNRTDLSILPFIINKVAEAFVEFFEKELITGTAKAQGLATIGEDQIVTAPSASAITADDLIDLQMSILENFQNNAIWLMNRETFKVIRKLKNADGEYLLNKDITTGFGWTLLGKRVYLTDTMPKIATGVIPIFYGDMSGLYMKFAQRIEIQMLNELYATQHAIGIVGFTEFDAKIIEPQKIAALKMA